MRSGGLPETPKPAPALPIHIRSRNEYQFLEIMKPASDTHKPKANGPGLWMTRLAGNPKCRLQQNHIQDESVHSVTHA